MQTERTECLRTHMSHMEKLKQIKKADWRMWISNYCESSGGKHERGMLSCNRPNEVRAGQKMPITK